MRKLPSLLKKKKLPDLPYDSPALKTMLLLSLGLRL